MLKAWIAEHPASMLGRGPVSGTLVDIGIMF